MQAKSLSIQRAGWLSLPALLCFNLFAVFAAAQVEVSLSTETPPSVAHVLYAPLAGMQDFEEWDLVLLNRNPIMQEITITIHSLDGRSYPPTAISLARTETRHIDIRTLLPRQHSGKTVGGIILDYYGPPMTVAARVTIRGFHGFGNLDVPLMESQEFKSTSLAAIWWEVPSARSYVVLGNSSGDIVHAEVEFGSGIKQLLTCNLSPLC